MIRILLALSFFLPVFAHAQSLPSIPPGKYKLEEIRYVHQTILREDGTGAALTEDRRGKFILIMQFGWEVKDGKYMQKNIRFSTDKVNWKSADDHAVDVQNITPESYETNVQGQWMKWIREE